MITGIDGANRFLRYAFPPNELGYCGPGDAEEVLWHASLERENGDARHLASEFEGAWPYLQLIAAANGIEDPLDGRVVDAYWVGNPLLFNIDPGVFMQELDRRFRPRAGSSWAHLADLAAAGAMPHHSLHVFGVYPWVGLLRAGHVDEPLRILDRCRIRWGTVTTVTSEAVQVMSQPLVWNGVRLALGAARLEWVTGAISTAPAIGDEVALHWDWVCERLSPGQRSRLIALTTHHLDLVNAQRIPGPTALLS